ncbi:ATP-binding protein [Jannaschia faecimaris]|nr:ATP-binding protein [Jannaschia faecimaris]
MAPTAIEAQTSGIVRTSFPAKPAEISKQLTALRGTFGERGLNDTLGDRVTLVLGEVLNNIVEHALSNHDSPILLEVTQVAGRVHVQTEDAGLALPSKLLGAVSLPDMGSTVEDLPESGFGWFIIHALVDDMVYERHDGRNRLSFSFVAA